MDQRIARGELDAAAAYARDAIAPAVQAGDFEAAETAVGASMKVASLQMERGQGRAAEASCRQLRETVARWFGPNTTQAIVAEYCVGRALLASNRAAEATPALQAANAQAKQLLGPPHPITVVVHYWLAMSYVQQRRLLDAVRELEELVPVVSASQGESSFRVLLMQGILAAGYVDLGRFTDSRTLLLKVVPRSVAAAELDRIVVVNQLRSLAQSETETGSPAAAEAHYGQALEVADRAGLPRNPKEAALVADVLADRARVLRLLGREDEAKASEARALSLRLGLSSATPR